MQADLYAPLFRFLESLIAAKIPEDEQKNIINIFKPIRLNKKELFIKEGDIPTALAFNVSGLLRCYYIDTKSNDVTKYFYFEGSIISYSGLLLKKASKYYIEALEDCVLLYVDYRSFELLTQDSFFWLKIIKTMQQHALIYKEERESSFLLETASERYVNLLHRYPYIEQRINLGHIASYLGISQVSLSRIRGKLRKI
ncbi:Crp/Fnr family transcriptional regulator [Paenibacillus sp. HW567]|uniref:Crp/Fnr family transcriptional regulator n=1 Tax=Paenibacillus sp. HW567 TaxID=1034769 RepID=UPI00037F69E6|nr:Crp/Fnr family transcriptional regulator [Paenibacillus sp. HW567]